MYGNCICQIERAANGYTLKINDPKIIAANKRGGKGDRPHRYRDPERSLVFTDVDTLLEFLKNNLDKVTAKDDYESSFDAAVAADDDD